MYPAKVASLTLLLSCLLSVLLPVICTTTENDTEASLRDDYNSYYPQRPQQHVQPTFADAPVTKPSHHKPDHHHQQHQQHQIDHHINQQSGHQSYQPPNYNLGYHPIQSQEHHQQQPAQQSGYKPIQQPIQHPVPVTTQPVHTTPQQNFPLVGAVFGNLPSYILPWNNFGNIGQSMGQQCPLGQFHRCRCENLLPERPPKSIRMDELQILQQSVKVNENGDMDIGALLNNGLMIHQKTSTKIAANNEKIQVHQGDFILKISEQRYLVIYFDIDDNDFSVKADVTKEVPSFKISVP